MFKKEMPSIKREMEKLDNQEQAEVAAKEKFRRDKEADEQREMKVLRYEGLLDSYANLARKIRGAPKSGDVVDEKLLKAHEEERAKLKAQIMELGVGLPKPDNDGEGYTHNRTPAEVMVELVRRDGNLAEYGLPEFSIMSDYDIMSGRKHREPEQFALHHQPDFINLKKDSAGQWGPGGIKKIEDVGSDERGNVSRNMGGGMPELRDSQVILLYNAAGISSLDQPPADWSPKDNRAKSFAGALKRDIKDNPAKYGIAEVPQWPFRPMASRSPGVRYSEEFGINEDGENVGISGVVLYKEDLEKAIELIKTNPQQFRFGEEFYSAKELEDIDYATKHGYTRRQKELSDIHKEEDRFM